ncbi:uncharacterized protein [Solanum tuberosum]|uniref:uncharacterized protein n=1 Tax=Solanum tuberosum TaxID=4113 RepID=UPI00073A0325|nr:PREDICTED: uncharacterized protein LOC107060189 [Solanum tuberosum]
MKGEMLCNSSSGTFSQPFCTPPTIISYGGCHSCNRMFASLLRKYYGRHNVATPYYLETGGQVEVSNWEIKGILAKIVNANWTDCSQKFDDALWAYQVAFKTTIGMSPYQLVFGKSFHLLSELGHKALWALKAMNLN